MENELKSGNQQLIKEFDLSDLDNALAGNNSPKAIM